MKIYADNRLLSLGVVCGTVSRHAGNMKEPSNQNALYGQLGIPPERMLHLHQTHSETLVSVLTEQDARAVQTAHVRDADGWILKPHGWGAAILTADCIPLFIWDENAGLVGLSHCGWRGVVQGLPGKTARELKKAGAKGRLQAYIGPHIQSCCFEVQQDVAQRFRPEFVLHKNGKLFVDLNREVIRQLEEAGLNAQDVKAPYYCTCGDKENFFSWRRDREKVNLLSFVYKP